MSSLRTIIVLHLLAFLAAAPSWRARVFAQAALGPGSTADTVVLAPRENETGRIVVRGTIVDYTGTTLVLDASGQRQTIPAKQVVDIRTAYSAEQTAADELWRRRDYAGALGRYNAALAVEKRTWVRRLLLSRVVACLREQEQWGAATEAFLKLVREDGATPYFATIPLPWTVVAADPSLEGKAKAWIADASSKTAGLLGASYLMSGATRSEALKRLRELTLDGDSRIALLAEAQLWRSAVVTADDQAVENWERVLDKIPEPLRAGPTLVVGRAWAQRNQPERAALLLTRVPILYADEHLLAAEALWSAGQMLEKLAEPKQASTLYRELVRDYFKSPLAAQATDRLKELTTQ